MSSPGRINYGGEPYVTISQTEQKRIARDPQVRPLAIRIYAAALSKVNADGHAEFSRGGLATYLGGTVVQNTGEVRPIDRYALRDAINAAKGMGLIAPSSSARCLVLLPTFAQKGSGGGGCKHHGIRYGGKPD